MLLGATLLTAAPAQLARLRRPKYAYLPMRSPYPVLEPAARLTLLPGSCALAVMAKTAAHAPCSLHSFGGMDCEHRAMRL